MPDWTELLEKKLEELPDGVAVWFVHDKLHPDTICFLVRAEGKMNHKFPPLSKLEILETGIAFFNPHDNKENNINAKGELMALGRALKLYNKRNAKPPKILNENIVASAFSSNGKVKVTWKLE